MTDENHHCDMNEGNNKVDFNKADKVHKNVWVKLFVWLNMSWLDSFMVNVLRTCNSIIYEQKDDSNYKL